MIRVGRTFRPLRHLPAALIAAALLVAANRTAEAQTGVPSVSPPRSQVVSLSGPRLGATLLTGKAARRAKDEFGVDRPLVTQFGWQFEQRFFNAAEGPVGLFEWVVLVGGLDQGAFFPSLNWITGVRVPAGFEFGAGPNLTPLGFGFAGAVGYNVRGGHMNFPINLALVSSDTGVRTSMLVGFTTRR